MDTRIRLEMISRLQNGSDEIRSSMTARYHRLGHEVRLAYKQILDPESGGQTPEILSIRLDDAGIPVQAVMKRPGSGLSLTFAPGAPCKALYDTPAGRMELCLLTQELDGAFEPDRVYLHLKYEMQLAQERLGVTEIILRGEKP